MPGPDTVAEFDGLAEQYLAAEFLALDIVGFFLAGMGRAAEAEIDIPHLPELPFPGQPEIELAGIATAVDRGADMRPWRPDLFEEFGGVKKDFEIGIDAVLFVAAERPFVMVENTQADLGQEAQPVGLVFMPKALRLPAQGCEALRATLGSDAEHLLPRRGCAHIICGRN